MKHNQIIMGNAAFTTAIAGKWGENAIQKISASSRMGGNSKKKKKKKKKKLQKRLHNIQTSRHERCD